MSFLAEKSDVEVVPHKVVSGSRAIHLSSEQRSEIPENFLFTTTGSVCAMFEEWWTEFKSRDGDAGTLNIKFRSLFRGTLLRESLKSYESADGKLCIEPPGNPNVGYSWLPAPAKTIELEVRDLIFLERNSRATLRVLNFIEIVLQAWEPGTTDAEMALRMRKSLCKAVKAMMQLQVVSTCELIQARRDHHLAGVRGLSVDNIQRLRHARILDDQRLFPTQLLKELNDVNYQHLQTRALLRAYKPDSRPQGGSRYRENNQGGHNNAYNNYSQRGGFNNNNSTPNWYVVEKISEVCPSSVSPVKEKRGGATVCMESRDSGSGDRGSSDTGSCDGTIGKNKDKNQISYDYSYEEKLIKEQSVIPVGGRLRFFWKHWREIGASKKYARWLNRGYRLPFLPGGEQEARSLLSSSCPSFLIPSYPKTSEKGVALLEMIDVLLQKDVIERVEEGDLCFFNVVFLRPKPNGKWRLILDVSRLNVFLATESFSMDTVQVIRQAVENGMWGTSIDLSDAYHHIPVHENFRCFLAFQVGDSKFRYKACPFGLSPLPRVFTEISEIVKVYARKSWGCVVFQYIDDWLFLSHDERHVAETTRLFVRLCIRLGLIVNLQKSILKASRQLVHLGTLWDFDVGKVRPPDEKINAISQMAHVAAKSTRIPLPTMESLMGKMVSVERLVPMGRLNYRAFQADLLHELKKGRSFRW